MGAKNSTPSHDGSGGRPQNPSNNRSGNRVAGPGGAGAETQSSRTNNQASGAPANQFAQQQRSNTAGGGGGGSGAAGSGSPAPGATNTPATNRAHLPSNRTDKQVQEGQMIKMLATIEASTVSYNPETHVLKFFITSTCSSLTYEIHTGVKESVNRGVVFYMPNKPKIEPTQIPLKGPQENREITVKLDVSRLEEREKSYDRHYPRQMPCVIVLRYKATEMKTSEGGENNAGGGKKEEVEVDHAEHTAVDLNPKPRRRVISQIVTAGNSSYVVENLFGAEGDNNEVTVGSTVANNNGGSNNNGESGGMDDDEDVLCVICLTNLKDTSVMPCRHMCLCKECGEELLRHKPVCPVCRAPISTLLHKPNYVYLCLLSSENNTRTGEPMAIGNRPPPLAHQQKRKENKQQQQQKTTTVGHEKQKQKSRTVEMERDGTMNRGGGRRIGAGAALVEEFVDTNWIRPTRTFFVFFGVKKLYSGGYATKNQINEVNQTTTKKQKQQQQNLTPSSREEKRKKERIKKSKQTNKQTTR
eukprot:gene13473-9281_t